MTSAMDRRQWIKCSALAAAAWAAARDRSYGAGFSAAEDGNTTLLDQNENPYGISARARRAILDAITVAHRYPGSETAELRARIAKREAVTPEHVILGAGSTEIFSLAGMLYAADGKKVLMADPTYSGFRSYMDRIGAKVVAVPVNRLGEHDLDSMAGYHTRLINLVYLCNPNNPTGTVVDSARLRSFCEMAARNSMVFVDEAYGDLAEEGRFTSMVDLVRRGANVMIARTFSKIHGLAGMRVGYGIARPEIVEEFRRIQTNFAPVSQVSLAAAQASEEDQEFISSSRKRNSEVRAGFYQLLDRLGYVSIPSSQTNFVIFEIDAKPDVFVDNFLKRFNIALRPFEFLDKRWVRVSMGTPEEMAKLAAALQKL